jgi:hypothetical protein
MKIHSCVRKVHLSDAHDEAAGTYSKAVTDLKGTMKMVNQQEL